VSLAAVLGRAVRRDRAVALGGLGLAVALAWAYLLLGAGLQMDPVHSAMYMPWTPADFVVMLAMWAVMMVAMMLPGAAPMILLFDAVDRKGSGAGSGHARTTVFLLGYLLVWLAFGLAATIVQWQLNEQALLSPMAMGMRLEGWLAGLLLVAAGLYQLTPLKRVCLRHCRTPLHFLADHWRAGAAGAVRMGAAHGLYCLGCCWALMALLFVGGVMDLVWVAGIAAFVLLEKVAPAGRWFASVAGAALIAWGGAVLIL
jgi:predicted metal-binding membrane protein